jgi:hypothetical protein
LINPLIFIIFQISACEISCYFLCPPEEGLITICLDLFTAGGETLNSSLGFYLLYMVLHPEVQKEVQKELDEVVGKGRRPTIADRAK